jgi:predicted nucleic acid-binding protein
LSSFVLDASVALCWFYEDQATKFSERVMHRLGSGDDAIVSAIWPFEIANSLVVAERRRLTSAGRIEQFVLALRALPIVADSLGPERATSETLQLARKQRLSASDASYLDLAMRTMQPLATVDNALRQVARSVGVDLLD